MRDGVRIALDVMLPPPERYDLSAGVPCVLVQTRVRLGVCAAVTDRLRHTARVLQPTLHRDTLRMQVPGCPTHAVQPLCPRCVG